MKFCTFFIVIASICLMAVNANDIDNFISNTEDVQVYEQFLKDLAKDIMEIEQQGKLINPMAALKAVKCAMEEVPKIQTAAASFVADIIVCGDKPTKQVDELVAIIKDIANTCMEIIEIGKSCLISSPEEVTTVRDIDDANSKVSIICTARLMAKIFTLGRQILDALNLINPTKSIDIPEEASKCLLDAIIKLRSFLSELPADFRACYQQSSY